jgi:zinc protease
MPQLTLESKLFRFKSGLRLIVEEDHGSPVVGVVSVVGVGSSSDPPGKEGLAHFVEHLGFRSKPDGKAGISSLLARVGAASYNATTSLDRTTYFAFGSTQTLESLVGLEGARLVNPIANVDRASFDVEREVVRNELRLRNETGYYSQFLTWAQSAVFPPEHPYSRPLIGTQESLSAIKLEDAQEFARSHYRPDNMLMVIMGDVDSAQLAPILQRALPPPLWEERPAGAQNPPPAEPQALPEPPPHPLYRFNAAVDAPELLMAWSVPRAESAEGLMLDTLVLLLNSALHQLSDEDVSRATAGLLRGKDGSVLICEAHLKRGVHPEQTAQRIQEHVRRTFRTTPYGRGIEQQSRGYAQIRFWAHAHLIYELEDIQTRAVRLAQSSFAGGPEGAYTRSLHALEQLDARQASQWVDRYLDPKRARLALVLPSAEGAPSEADQGDLPEPSDDAVTVSYPPQAIRSIIHPVPAKQFQTVRLENGLEVVVARRRAWPVVTLELAVRGGTATAQPRGVAELASLAKPKGVGEHGQPSQYGIEIRERPTEDALLTLVEAGSGNFDVALAMLADRAQGLEIRESALTRFQTEVLPPREREEQLPKAQANRAFWNAIYWPDRFGYRATAEELKRVKVEELQQWVDQTYSPNNSILAIVGDVDPAEAVNAAQHWFGGWKAPKPSQRKAQAVPAAAASETRKSVLVTHRPAATQAEIQFGCAAHAESPTEALAYRLLAELVSTALFDAARERLGATYGFRATAKTFAGGNSQIVVNGSVNNSHLRKVLSLIREHWPTPSENDLSEQSIDRIRWGLARRYNLQYATTPALASAVVQIRLQGWSPEVFEEFPDRLLAITPADVKKAANECRKTAAISVLGDEKTIDPALKDVWN